MLLQFTGNGDFDEEEFDPLDAEYHFLHDTLGWGEGLAEMEGHGTPSGDEPARGSHAPRDLSTGNVQKLAGYLFLTEQMNWKKGLKIFAEKGKGAIEKELKQIHNIQHGGVPAQALT